MLAALAFAAQASATLVTCAALATGERQTCIDAWARQSSADWRAGRELDELLGEHHEELALTAVDRLLMFHEESLAEEPQALSRLHDLRGRALDRLGRSREAASAFGQAVRLDDGTVRVAWLSDQGEVTRAEPVSIGNGLLERAGLHERAAELGGGSAQIAAPLLAPTWHAPLPELTLSALDGTEVRIPPADAKALVLAFWASWCVPCAEELPRLQALARSESARGLRVITINVGEPAETIAIFAEAIGLELPVALQNSRIEEALRIESLPTTIVADRQGWIRLRSDGYKTGSEEDLAQLVRELLDDATGIELEPVADVLAGGGQFEAAWVRQVPAAIEGIALFAAGEDDEGGRIVLTVGREVAVLTPNGTVVRRAGTGPIAGLLRPLRKTADGAPAPPVLSFRQGARRVALIDPWEEDPRSWDAPAPVLDLEVRPDAPEVLLGTTAGLYRASPTGEPFSLVSGSGEVRDVAVSGDAILLLGAGGRLTWLDRELHVVREEETGLDDAARLLVGPDGRPVAVGQPGIVAWAVGRFFETPAPQIALATADGQLVLLDAAHKPRFRARFQRLQGLAAGDLDQDGRDELLVTAGDRLVLLRASR